MRGKVRANEGAIFDYLFEGDASNGCFNLTLHNLDKKKDVFKKQPVFTKLFEQIEDLETAKENVKKRLELLIRE